MQNLQVVQKYLSSSDKQTINDLNKAIEEPKTTVTFMGLYNHGKSTLLNVLIKDFEYKTFKTADVRETSINQIVEHGKINFVDTPGLNAKAEDDKKVMEAIKQSDINIFVHSVTTGEFMEKEMEFLNNIKKHWESPQEFIARTIFVVSRIDKANNEEDIVTTIKKMSLQINTIFNSKAKIIPVSATRYTKGTLENKKIMVKKSNIEQLEESIEELSHKLLNSIQKSKYMRLGHKYDDLIRRLNSKVQEKKLEISKKKNEREEYLNALKSDIKEVEMTVKSMYSTEGLKL